MRKTDRNRIPVPPILQTPGGAGHLETLEAISFFSRKNIPANESFTYKVYAHASVKNALKQVFYSKCAYCEINATAGYDVEIEHFRPKAEINNEGEKAIKPGYYWLGATWENLFLSCTHCNQWRIQPLPDGGQRNMGKKNQFPLSDQRKRVKTYKRDIHEEEPYRLLLDPCIDTPEDHLTFDQDGMIYPRQQAGEPKSQKGMVSIAVFALYRKDLVDARRNHALIVRSALSTLKKFIDNYNEAVKKHQKAAAINKCRLDMKEEIEKLQVFTEPNQPFSLMSLCIIKDFLKPYGIRYPK